MCSRTPAPSPASWRCAGAARCWSRFPTSPAWRGPTRRSRCGCRVHVQHGRHPAASPGSGASISSSRAAVQSGLWALAVIGVLTSVVGAYYYIRVIKVMYFDAPEEAFDPRPASLSTLAAATGAVHRVVLRLPRAVRGRRERRGDGPCSDESAPPGRLAAHDPRGSAVDLRPLPRPCGGGGGGGAVRPGAAPGRRPWQPRAGLAVG